MIVKFNRVGGGLGEPQYIKLEPLHKNTVLNHKFTVRVDLFENESVMITFGRASGEVVTPLTKPLAPIRSFYVENGVKGAQYSVKLPNALCFRSQAAM